MRTRNVHSFEEGRPMQDDSAQPADHGTQTDAPSGSNAAMAPDPVAEARAQILAAALPNVPFDGWSEATLSAATRAAGVDPSTARLAFPRGALDLALAFHDDGDARLAQALAAAPLEGMRMRDKIAFAVRTRLEIVAPHREAVRRGATLFALPPYAGDGAKAIWRTADTIWAALGDASQDGNWYSKRAILSGVYSATVLYWLGDSSERNADTWAFLDRRIDGVMQFEKVKGQINANPLGRLFMVGPNMVTRMMKPPRRA
jgi:ubiquinone biosynthesis protein COQ9